jgi:hypothetical protein
MENVTGRRRSRRFELQMAAQVSHTCQPAEPGRLCDLSDGGAMILSPLTAEFGTKVHVRFTLVPDLVCEAVGRVLRTVAFGDQHGVAFEFSQMNDPFKHFLHNLAGAVADERSRFLDDVQSLSVELVTD